MGKGNQADAAQQAAQVQADAQREMLDYLKETDAIPRQFREGAMQQLGALFGIGTEGQDSNEVAAQQQQMIEGMRQNPLYQAMVGNQAAGEEAIMRQQAATGGLRSGTTQMALADYGTQLQNQALMQTYNQQVGGLQSMMGLPSNTNAIAQTMGQIGQTQAQGITGAAAAQAGAGQAGFSNLLNMVGTGAALFALSDPRLKDNIEFKFEKNGVKFYNWDWNETAKEIFGLSGSDEGVLTTEHPDCVVIDEESGYCMVDYMKIADKVGE